MKVEFVDPFVSAAFKVLGMVTGDAPTRGDISLRRTPFTTQEITIMAGVNGQVEGTALYGMSLTTAKKVASAMMGCELETLDEMAWSALSELGNMITGNATTLLSQNGYEVDITPPSVIRGTDVEVSTKAAALVVPVQLQLGCVEINVALQEIAMRQAA